MCCYPPTFLAPMWRQQREFFSNLPQYKGCFILECGSYLSCLLASQANLSAVLNESTKAVTVASIYRFPGLPFPRFNPFYFLVHSWKIHCTKVISCHFELPARHATTKNVQFLPLLINREAHIYVCVYYLQTRQKPN